MVNGGDVPTAKNNSGGGKVRRIDGYRPEPRYGHSQMTLDDERVLIIGGCGGPNKVCLFFVSNILSIIDEREV